MDGHPHAAWMGAAASEDMRHIYTLTSPDSAKIRNLASHPESEWMLVDGDRDLVLYARGSSCMVRDSAVIKHAWQLFPDKSRVYFLSFFNSSPGYAVIETTVTSLEWLLPKEGRRGVLQPEDLMQCAGSV
jgi:general stress protein 26